MHSMEDVFVPPIMYNANFKVWVLFYFTFSIINWMQLGVIFKSSKQMFNLAVGFYSSLGLGVLPKTVWNRSIFEWKSNFADCQAAAWDFYKDNDFR